MPAVRAHGSSHFSAWRLIRLSLDGLTAFTIWPLRAVSAMGFLLATLAFVYGAYLLAAFFMQGNKVSGWTTIVVSLMLFAGIQLISLASSANMSAVSSKRSSDDRCMSSSSAWAASILTRTSDVR